MLPQELLTVGVYGKVNMRCNGIPSLSAQCMCAKEGGLAMIASAMNGAFLPIIFRFSESFSSSVALIPAKKLTSCHQGRVQHFQALITKNSENSQARQNPSNISAI